MAGSRIGFGCAGLMRVTSAAERDRLLGAAFDAGIHHFDVARLYGLGTAERELGRFARARRADVTIATKFGLNPAGGLGRLGRLQEPVRALANRVPSVRAALKKRAGSMVSAGTYDVDSARASLDTSLRELGLDYVDHLFIHAPGPSDALDTAALLAFFQEARQAGKIGAWGISYDEVEGYDPISELGPEAVLQVRETVLQRTRRMGARLTFGVLGEPLGVITAALARDAALRAAWTGALGADAAGGPAIARLLLSDALEANPEGTVLYTTGRPDRMAFATGVVADPAPPEATQALRTLVQEHHAAFAAAGEHAALR